MLVKAPYSEYSNKNLINLQKLQKKKLAKLNVTEEELARLEKETLESAESMNATYIL